MSSSVGNSSLLNLALLNQLLQKAGAETTDAGGASDSQATQDSSSGMSFSTQADALINALDTDGDGTLSQSELEAAFSSTGTTQGSDTTSVSNASSQGSTLGTAENWDAWMQQMQGSNTGDVANQSAMNSLQQSTKMDNTLTQLLQAVENYQASASGAV